MKIEITFKVKYVAKDHHRQKFAVVSHATRYYVVPISEGDYEVAEALVPSVGIGARMSLIDVKNARIELRDNTPVVRYITPVKEFKKLGRYIYAMTGTGYNPRVNKKLIKELEVEVEENAAV